MVENNADAIAVLSAAGKVLYVSPAGSVLPAIRERKQCKWTYFSPLTHMTGQILTWSWQRF
jgi:hypothetical protein